MSLKPEAVLPLLTTKTIGRGSYRWAYEMDSTNAVALGMARSGAPDGSLAVCEKQSSGRGRFDRSWESEPGLDLTQSVIHDLPDTGLAPLIPLAASVAMCRVLSFAAEDVAIKWPNDVLVGGKKIAGILCGLSGSAVVIGAGLNVNRKAFPHEIEATATSLTLVTGKLHPLPQVFALYLNRLEETLQLLEEKGNAKFLDVYRPLCVTLGKQVRVRETCGEWIGQAEAVDENGCLVVEKVDGKRVHLYAGDVSVRGMMGYCPE